MTLTAIDRKIISSLCGDLPESLVPFEEIARRIGVSEEELLGAVERFRRSGLLRRFGGTVDHRRVGLGASAMVVWRVPGEKVKAAARTIVSCSAVTHCYQREPRPAWPFNLYAMLHGKTRAQCKRVAGEMSRTIASEEYRLLFTVREFKKISPEYFRSGRGGDEQRR